MIELVVGPARKHVAFLGVAHDEAVGSELDQHRPPRAGHAVEEDAGARSRHCQIPPTLSASASPSPTAELAAPAALTRSSTSRPESSIDSKAGLPETQSHGRLVDGRIGERNDHIGCRSGVAVVSSSVTVPLPSHSVEPADDRERNGRADRENDAGDKRDPHEAQIDRVDGARGADARWRSARQSATPKSTSAAPSPEMPDRASAAASTDQPTLSTATTSAGATPAASIRPVTSSPPRRTRLAERGPVDRADRDNQAEHERPDHDDPEQDATKEQPRARADEVALQIAIVGVAQLEAFEARLRERIGEPEREARSSPTRRSRTPHSARPSRSDGSGCRDRPCA